MQIFWWIVYFLVTHLLICSWVRYDARMRGINHLRWYKFCVFAPVIGIVFYGIAKRAWKAWTLIVIFWLVNPALYFVIRWLIGFMRERFG